MYYYFIELPSNILKEKKMHIEQGRCRMWHVKRNMWHDNVFQDGDMEAKRRAIEQAEEEVGLASHPAFNQSMLYQIEQMINILSMSSSLFNYALFAWI